MQRGAGDVSELVECLSRIHDAPSLILNTTRKRKKGGGEQEQQKHKYRAGKNLTPGLSS